MKHKKFCILGALLFMIIPDMNSQINKKAPYDKQNLEVLPQVNLTVIVDNLSGGESLGEWGVSYLLESGSDQILFDTGLGLAFPQNIRILKVDMKRTDAIVISHEHDDHTGGLKSALKACGPVDLFIHPDAFLTRYWKFETGPSPHHLPLTEKQLKSRVRNLIKTKEPTVVCKGMVVTGEIPRVYDFEDTGLSEYAYMDEKLKIPDLILDDQAIFFRVPEGLVIVLGCAHAGILNTLKYITDLTGEKKIYAIIGGSHLHNASDERMQKTITALKQYDVQRIMLSHCTGINSFTKIACALPGRCKWPATGEKIQFGGK